MTELILPCHIITVDMILYMLCVRKKNVLSGHSPTMDRFLCWITSIWIFTMLLHFFFAPSNLLSIHKTNLSGLHQWATLSSSFQRNLSTRISGRWPESNRRVRLGWLFLEPSLCQSAMHREAQFYNISRFL